MNPLGAHWLFLVGASFSEITCFLLILAAIGTCAAFVCRTMPLSQALDRFKSFLRGLSPHLAIRTRNPDAIHGEQVDENVQFSVYRPSLVRPERWYSLLAFAHLSERRPDSQVDVFDPAQEVERQARLALGGAVENYRSVMQDARFGVPRQGEITFLPEADGIEFNPPRRTFRWQEDVHREEFRFRVPTKQDGQTIRGRLTVFNGCLILAEIAFAMRVDFRNGETTSGNEHEPLFARPYRKVFASYSHKDAEILRIVEMCSTALGEYKYLIDAKNLRAGEFWSERLEQLIKDADVFQLFWSKNSMHSLFVRKEWEFALSLQRRDFIRPVYWERPRPACSEKGLPPKELGGLHFQEICELPRNGILGAPPHEPNLRDRRALICSVPGDRKHYRVVFSSLARSSLFEYCSHVTVECATKAMCRKMENASLCLIILSPDLHRRMRWVISIAETANRLMVPILVYQTNETEFSPKVRLLMRSAEFVRAFGRPSTHVANELIEKANYLVASRLSRRRREESLDVNEEFRLSHAFFSIISVHIVVIIAVGLFLMARRNGRLITSHPVEDGKPERPTDVVQPVAGFEHGVKPWSGEGKNFLNGADIEMVWVRPGTFKMGSENGERGEQPIREVKLTQGYWLGKSEVTKGQWREVMGNNADDLWNRGDFSVGSVSWDEALAFCAKLTEKERAAGRLPAGYEYQLPTKAEWKYACRAGKAGDPQVALESLGFRVCLTRVPVSEAKIPAGP